MSLVIKVYECPCLPLLPVIHTGIFMLPILVILDSVGLDFLIPKRGKLLSGNPARLSLY